MLFDLYAIPSMLKIKKLKNPTLITRASCPTWFTAAFTLSCNFITSSGNVTVYVAMLSAPLTMVA